MKWTNFLHTVGDIPLIHSELVYTAARGLASAEVQISRWKKMGRLLQLKKGVYLINRPYRSNPPWEPYIAAELTRPSYISLEKAMEMHNLIPEAVFVFTCVTAKRPAHYETAIGTFDYRHIRRDLFFGYEPFTQQNQTAFLATPEKALLDYVYFLNGAVTQDTLEELRLQNLDLLSEERLLLFAAKFRKPKILRAAKEIAAYRKKLLRSEHTL